MRAPKLLQNHKIRIMIIFTQIIKLACARTEGTVNRLKMLTEQGIIDKHYYLNPILEQVSDDEVKGKVNMLIANQHKREEHPRWSSTGLADLVFRRTERRWKISEFHVRLDRPDPGLHP